MSEDRFLCLMWHVLCVPQEITIDWFWEGATAAMQLCIKVCLRRRVLINNNQMTVSQMAHNKQSTSKKRAAIVKASCVQITWYNKLQWRECAVLCQRSCHMAIPQRVSVWRLCLIMIEKAEQIGASMHMVNKDIIKSNEIYLQWCLSMKYVHILFSTFMYFLQCTNDTPAFLIFCQIKNTTSPLPCAQTNRSPHTKWKNLLNNQKDPSYLLLIFGAFVFLLYLMVAH